jgi:hypothetical protein
MKTLEKNPTTEETNRTNSPDINDQETKTPNQRPESPETNPAWKNPDPTKPEKINVPYAGDKENASDEDEDTDLTDEETEDTETRSPNKPGYPDIETDDRDARTTDVEGTEKDYNGV